MRRRPGGAASAPRRRRQRARARKPGSREATGGQRRGCETARGAARGHGGAAARLLGDGRESDRRVRHEAERRRLRGGGGRGGYRGYGRGVDKGRLTSNRYLRNGSTSACNGLAKGFKGKRPGEPKLEGTVLPPPTSCPARRATALSSGAGRGGLPRGWRHPGVSRRPLGKIRSFGVVEGHGLPSRGVERRTNARRWAVRGRRRVRLVRGEKRGVSD